MDIVGLVVFLIIGASAGWLVGVLMKVKGIYQLESIVIGIVGALFGGFLFGLIGNSVDSLVGSTITSTSCAVSLLFAVSFAGKSN